MDELEIKRYLLGNEHTAKYFLGTLAYDELPITKHQTGFYIVNTGHSSTPGIHWVVILKIDDIIEFFDSLANLPGYYSSSIENYLIRNGPSYKMSIKKIQGESNFCGNYCILYCYFRCRKYNMLDFLNLFSNNLKKNDNLVNLHT